MRAASAEDEQKEPSFSLFIDVRPLLLEIYAFDKVSKEENEVADEEEDILGTTGLGSAAADVVAVAEAVRISLTGLETTPNISGVIMSSSGLDR